jgi:hypothetical protein
MFLVGGPAFSGTTLLAHLLNQGDVVCLDEPDFHDPEQSHRAIPLLRTRFPDARFPDPPARPLDPVETVRFTEACAEAIRPRLLGVKTCDWNFLKLVPIYRKAGYPVIAIFRDIRDALVRELPEWVTEESLSAVYRRVWRDRDSFDLSLRYEDLVTDPDAALANISPLLGRPLRTLHEWNPGTVDPTLLKLERHDLLTEGRISRERVGIWRSSGRGLAPATHETAALMGYAAPPARHRSGRWSAEAARGGS